MFTRFKSLEKKLQTTNTLCVLDYKDGMDMLQGDILSELKELIIQKKWKRIEIIDVNKAQDHVVAKYFPILIQHTQVEFTLRGCSLGDETALTLASLLQRNPRLTDFHFGGFSVTDVGLQALGMALKRHKHIQKFGILCGPNTTNKAILQFAMLMAENISWVTYDVNGIVYSPQRKHQGIFHFVLKYLSEKIVIRNKELLSLTPAKQFLTYNEFVKRYNEEIKEQFSSIIAEYDLGQSGLTLENFQLPFKTFHTLKQLCLFAIDQYAEKKIPVKEVILPADLHEELNNNFSPTLYKK